MLALSPLLSLDISALSWPLLFPSPVPSVGTQLPWGPATRPPAFLSRRNKSVSPREMCTNTHSSITQLSKTWKQNPNVHQLTIKGEGVPVHATAWTDLRFV